MMTLSLLAKTHAATLWWAVTCRKLWPPAGDRVGVPVGLRDSVTLIKSLIVENVYSGPWRTTHVTRYMWFYIGWWSWWSYSTHFERTSSNILYKVISSRWDHFRSYWVWWRNWRNNSWQSIAIVSNWRPKSERKFAKKWPANWWKLNPTTGV